MGAIEKTRLVNEILTIEWDMFKVVNNIGGKAPCQHDQETFVVMRGAFYLVWDEDTLASFLDDLHKAKNLGRNLVMEKYARMMAYSDPAYYQLHLQPHLPRVETDAKNLAEAITARFLSWEADFMYRYPALGKRSRALTSVSSSGETGETEYLLGELLTYSTRTLANYDSHLKKLEAIGVNPVDHIKEAVVRKNGFLSLQDAEQRMDQKI